jgi:hypothetical protein
MEDVLGRHQARPFQPDVPAGDARHVRLNILQANEGPTISEIQWIEKGKKK